MEIFFIIRQKLIVAHACEICRLLGVPGFHVSVKDPRETSDLLPPSIVMCYS